MFYKWEPFSNNEIDKDGNKFLSDMSQSAKTKFMRKAVWYLVINCPSMSYSFWQIDTYGLSPSSSISLISFCHMFSRYNLENFFWFSRESDSNVFDFLLRHTPSMYPLSPGAGFRSPYPSALPGPSDFYRFSPTGLIQPHPGLSPHPPHLGSHPAIVTPGPKQELPDINNRYGDIYR